MSQGVSVGLAGLKGVHVEAKTEKGLILSSTYQHTQILMHTEDVLLKTLCLCKSGADFILASESFSNYIFMGFILN